VYGVLHDRVYRGKYALNLQREFPRIPFYPDFWQWSDWRKALMDLHIGYESVEPWPLERTDLPVDGGTPVRVGHSRSLLAEIARPSPDSGRAAKNPAPRRRC
jgi:Type ISP C-terminal specificity domain